MCLCNVFYYRVESIGMNNRGYQNNFHNPYTNNVPQMNPHMMNNHLLAGHQQYASNRSPFANNAMLSNNPMFMTSIYDPAFGQRLQMEKLGKMRRAKNISDLNVSQDQLMKYVINPIVAERLDMEKAMALFNQRDSTYDHIDRKTAQMGENTIARIGTTSKLLDEWWNGRTNMPYKNILKNENYKKEFKKKEDLTVYKYSAVDKDKIKLAKELVDKKKKLERHNKELKIVFSASNEAACLEEFEYVQKYKYRIKYDPKNFSDLKKSFKKEQKRLIKDSKRIDDIIELALNELDDISEEDRLKIKELQKIDNELDTYEIEDPTEKLQKEIEKQLRSELGEQFDELMEVFNEDEEGNDECEEKEKSVRVKIKSKKDKRNDDNDKGEGTKRKHKNSKNDDDNKSETVSRKHKSSKSDNTEIVVSKKKHKKDKHDEVIVEDVDEEPKIELIRPKRKVVIRSAKESPTKEDDVNDSNNAKLDSDMLSKYKSRKSKKEE
jgi:hypothetical protein